MKFLTPKLFNFFVDYFFRFDLGHDRVVVDGNGDGPLLDRGGGWAGVRERAEGGGEESSPHQVRKFWGKPS